MDFGKILESDYAWEGFTDKDAGRKEQQERPGNNDAKIKIDDTVDLHGLTIAEARSVLDVFFDNAQKKGFRKVLIIHGKGNHSPNGPVLGVWVKEYLTLCKKAGRAGYADKHHGGSGATWVMLKK